MSPSWKVGALHCWTWCNKLTVDSTTFTTWHRKIMTSATLWRACNLTAFVHSSTGPVVHPFASRHEGPVFQSIGGVLMWHRDSPFSVVSLHWWPRRDWSLGLVWGGLHSKLSPGCRDDNVIIPLDLTQLFCPGFTLAAGPPSGFTTDIVGCWAGALCRACNLTAFIHSSTGTVVQPLASCYEGPGFNPQGGTSVKPGFSC